MSQYYSQAFNSFDGSNDKQIIARRLREAGVDESRFVPLREGTKESYTDHTNPENQYDPETVEGNYGVMAGNGLVVVDVDGDRPDALGEWPDTLTVETPHDGTHHFFAVSEPVASRSEEWGELQGQGRYVVGPESRLTACKEGCCGPDSPGQYRVVADRPIAALSVDRLRELAGGASGQDSTPEPREDNTPQADSGVIEKRVTKARESKHGETFKALWEGRYRDAGHDDRSDAEAELVARLGFWFGQDRGKVRRAMDMACRDHPGTDMAEQRKWADRGETYRDVTLKNGLAVVNGSYSPGSGSTVFRFRPEFSSVLWEQVYDAVIFDGPLTTKEIAEQTDRGHRQVQRVVRDMVDEGLVHWARDGRQRIYAVTEAQLPNT